MCHKQRRISYVNRADKRIGAAGRFNLEEELMLVLTRKVGEKIVIGKNITITVLEARGSKIRIGIDAPAQVPVLRSELQPGTDGDVTESERPPLAETLRREGG